MPDLRQLYHDIMATPGIVGKIVNANAIWGSYQERGEWEDDEHSSKWSFLMGDYCGGFWLYSIWLLLKKVLLSAVLNLLEGQANAIGALLVQVVDSGLLLYMRPFVSRQADVSEAIGTVTNLLAYLSISLPLISPSLGFFGEFLQIALATFSTVIGAFFSMMAPLFAVIKLVTGFFSFLFGIPSQFLACSAALFSGGSVFMTIKDAIYGNVKDALQEQVEDKYALEEPDEEEDEDEEDGEHEDDAEHEGNDDASAFGLGGIAAAGLAAAGLAGASCDAPCSVTSTIIMNKDFKEIGEEGSPERNSFENSLLDDLAYASGLCQDKFVIKSMSAGSVVVEVEITGDTADEAAKAAKDLQQQACNPLSRLRHGAVTSYVTSIKNKSDSSDDASETAKSLVTMGTFSQEEMLSFAGRISAKKSEFETLFCKDLAKASGMYTLESTRFTDFRRLTSLLKIGI